VSKKEEALRRSVLSREGSDRDRAAKRRAVQVLATAGVLAMGAIPLNARRVDYDAERGRFSSGAAHPDKCSCAKCAEWRRAERYR
jgi:hypothetical protein